MTPRFLPVLAMASLLAAGCVVSGTGSVTPGAVPSAAAASAAPSAAPAGTPPASNASTAPSLQVPDVLRVDDPAPTPGPGAPDQTLAGTGSDVSKGFKLEKGATIMKVKTAEKQVGSFTLKKKSDGKPADLPVSFFGETGGLQFTNVDAAEEYFVEASATGSWTVEITQPRPTTGAAWADAEGSGDTVIGPFSAMAGVHKFTVDYKGDTGINVTIYNVDGSQEAFLGGQFKAGKMAKTATLKADRLYWMTVSGTGGWSVKRESL